MEYEILCDPSYSLLEMKLQPGDKIVAEAGAMAWMDSHVKVKTQARGGIFAALKRSLLSGESFFQNTYYVEDDEEEAGIVGLAAGSAGSIVPYVLGESSDELILEKGAYLASDEGVNCDTKWQGLKGFFNEGLFALRCTGSGLLFFNGYGHIQEIEIDGEYIVDNGYAVAWEPQLEWRLSKAKKIRSFLFSDQLVLRFSGQGKIWVQSRTPQSFANWAHNYRPVANQGGGIGDLVGGD